jgi:hypothetical protein
MPTRKPAPKKKKVAAKPARRRIPSKSPLAGMSVDSYIASKLKGWQADAVRTLLRIVMGAAPDVEVGIKWAQPVFSILGPFAYIKPASSHVTFGFWRGAELPDPRGLLEGGARMKHLKLGSLADIDEPTITAFVRDAVALNRAKGDPTKR